MARKASRSEVERVAVGYVRVSTDEQANGPEAQRAAMTAWAAREGVRIVGWYDDLGVSGAAPLDARPGLLSALEAVAEHGADLLVAKRDRLARDTMIAAMIDRLVERDGRRVLTADGGNGTGPEADMLRGILDLFAQYERQIIRARTRAALQAKRARGERVGTVPFGYRDDSGRLVEHEAEQAVIAAVRAMRAAGWTIRAIVDDLARAGTVGRTGRPLGETQVSRLLDRAAA